MDTIKDVQNEKHEILDCNPVVANNIWPGFRNNHRTLVLLIPRPVFCFSD